MDSKAVLDYAVFHLTPTRTRCDLVLFRGKSSEKLASGLVEPFVSHLQYAKDQIPKGGYSITLRPPSSSGDDDDASWFTKATFQRFVRFVSTPEILERIMRLEREILQIESSLHSNEVPRIEEASHQGEGTSPVSNGNTKKSTNSSSTEEEDGSVLKESSKAQLQRLMDTRKALLMKEQAMAYARAVVAGYEIETIDDLVCFADAFGASRLRAACTDFKDLYKKKHSDDQWMDELAAVQAFPPVPDLSYMGTSGITLAGENLYGNNGIPLARTSSDTSDGSRENSTVPESNANVQQQQVPWMNMNQIPQYMYMPPHYQGYPVPYFPGFPPPKDRKKHKSSKKKDKNSEDSESSEEEEEQSDDSSSSNGDSAAEDRKHSSKGKKQSKKKKKKNKGSKTVVIRNINYITSQKRGGEEDDGASGDESSEDISLDGDSIREGVESAISSLGGRNGDNHSHSKSRKNGGKRTENGEQEFGGGNDGDINGGKASNPWGAFQNLLLSHEDSAASNMKSFDEHLIMKNSNGDFHFESEKIKKHPTADDSFLVVNGNGANGFRENNTLDFTNNEAKHPMMKKQTVSEGENLLFSQQNAESRSYGLDFSSESAGKIPRGGDDWFVANSSGNSHALNHKQQIDFGFDGDFIKKEKPNESSVADDSSFIIESTRSGFNDTYAPQWKTDITATFDETSRADNESPNNTGPGLARSMEPDELCMVLARESHESTASWAPPEVDYAAEISFTEVDKKSSIVKEDAVATAAEEKNGKKEGVKKITKTPVKALSRSRLDSLAKSKTGPGASRSTMQKNKLQREEEERKRTEELVIQRQKRIAERTATNNGLSPGATKKLTNKATTPPPKVNGTRKA